jgi:hypothetical protein
LVFLALGGSVLPVFTIQNLDVVPANAQLQWRVIEKPARGKGDAILLSQSTLLTAIVENNGEARLPTEQIKPDLAVWVLLVGRRGSRPVERILYKKAYDSVSEIRDQETVRIELGDADPQAEPIAEPANRQPTPKPLQPDIEDRPGPAVTKKPRPAVRPPKSLAKQIGERQVREQQLGEDLRGVIRPAVERRNNKLKAGRLFAGKVLGQRPLGRKQGSGFVPVGSDTEQAVERQVSQSMQSLKASHRKRKGISIRGPKGISWEPGKLKTSADLINAIPGAVGAGTITNRSSPLQGCLIKRKVEEIFAEDDTTPTDETVPANETEVVTASQSLEEMLQSIISSDPFQSALEKRPDQKDVENNLQMSLSSGPADETAYYDFDKLHIAWKDSWTAALSDKTASEVAELYAEIVQLVDYDPPEKSENAEVNELKQLLVELGGVVSSVSAEMQVPTDLQAWLGDDLLKVWTSMASSEQQELSDLYWVHDYCNQNKEALIVGEKIGPFPTKDMAKTTVDIFNNGAISCSSRVYQQGEAEVNWFVDYNIIHKNEEMISDDFGVDSLSASIWDIANEDLALKAAENLMAPYLAGLDSGDITSPLGRAEQLITKLQTQSDKPYQFDIFVPDSVNFGLLTTYRQQWRPLAYQAGDLVGTIPLAPNEKRTYSIKESVSQTSKSNQSRTLLTSRNEEYSSLARSEAEIQRKTDQLLKAGANLDSTNTLDAKAGFLGIGFSGGTSLKVGGSLNSDMGNESSQTKKDIAETTRKIAQEFRDEHKVEISEESTRTYESNQTREISNPNNEISVTYLFYELQRRFEVATRLQQVTPVIMVAFKVPNPDEINETWLLKYEWILRPALLDPKFGPVFRNLSESFAGDEIAVEILETQWKTQLAIVSELRRQMSAHTDLRDAARDAVIAASQEVRMASGASGSNNDGGSVGDALEYAALGLTAGVGGVLAKALFDGKKKDDEATESALSGEALGSERDSARQALDWADLDRAQSEGGLRESISALERATEKYLGAVQSRLNRRTQIDQLILHIKINIIHYMQAIWRAENRDQRYFRLYDVNVPWPDENLKMTSGSAVVQLENISKVPSARMAAPFTADRLEANSIVESRSQVVEPPNISPDSKRQLHEIADLDTIIGFRGNYAVFRVTEPNNISSYLLQDFLDSYFGLIDPDPNGNVLTVEEALEVAKCAWTHSDTTDEDKKEISEWLLEALDAANQASQMVIVPTGELFIEALPGTHPVLEDFKLKHRAADAQKAGADAKMAEIEVLRRAQRILDGDLTDPDVDKSIRIDGGAIHNLSVDGT